MILTIFDHGSRMRFILILSALSLAFTANAAASDAPSAQSAFVERRGLLEADSRCRLFTADMRAALQAGAAQARGALLRGAWSRARIDELERAAAAAARARSCDDPRTAAAAAQVRAAFASWARTPAMAFPGWERSWTARRHPDALGWRLVQEFETPAAGVFGVRDQDGAQRLTLAVPLASGQVLPASAQLVMRDPARASAAMLDLPGRTARGLAAGAPAPATSVTYFASARGVETIGRAQRQAMLVFPDAAFEAMLALDPREAVEIRLQTNRSTQRILIEVGDIAAARAFLAIRAQS